MRADAATQADIASWLEIVREVEPLFGPMPNFEATLERKIGQAAALCVRSAARETPRLVLGGVLLGGTRDEGWIRWLAVRANARTQGVGQCLVRAAIQRMKSARTISLDTFREEDSAGRPARRLYSRTGFVAGPLVEADGQPRQRFMLTQR